jgi:hypothetical protein
MVAKSWAIKLATEAARTVLSVDQIIVARQAGGPKPPGPNPVSFFEYSMSSLADKIRTGMRIRCTTIRGTEKCIIQVLDMQCHFLLHGDHLLLAQGNLSPVPTWHLWRPQFIRRRTQDMCVTFLKQVKAYIISFKASATSACPLYTKQQLQKSGHGLSHTSALPSFARLPLSQLLLHQKVRSNQSPVKNQRLNFLS